MTTTKPLFDIKNMVLMALFAAFMCILAPLAVPIGPVPISLTNLILYIGVFVLGWQRTVITYTVYLLLGIAGLPVFSGFQGGIGKIAGPTGGYLIGFILTTVICGLFLNIPAKKKTIRYMIDFTGMIVGTAVAYALETVWFCLSTDTGLWAALLICVFPFIIGDIVKIILALVVAPTLTKQFKPH